MPLFERQCASEVLWSTVLLVVGGGDRCSSKGYLCARNCRSTWECSCRIGAASPEKTVGLITKWSSSTHMHAAWTGNRRNWNPLCSMKTMTSWIGSRWCLRSNTNHSVILWRDGLKLHLQRFRLDIRKNYFSERVARCWNRLCREVVELPSLQCSKDVDVTWRSMLWWLTRWCWVYSETCS